MEPKGSMPHSQRFPITPILSRINSNPRIHIYFLKVHSNIVPSRPRPSQRSLSSRFTDYQLCTAMEKNIYQLNACGLNKFKYPRVIRLIVSQLYESLTCEPKLWVLEHAQCLVYGTYNFKLRPYLLLLCQINSRFRNGNLRHNNYNTTDAKVKKNKIF